MMAHSSLADLLELPSQRSSRLLFICLLIFLSSSSSAYSQPRPLVTETVRTVEEGDARVEIGFEFLQDISYRFSGLEGDLARLGVLGLRFGAGEKVELQMFWTAQNFLKIAARTAAPNSPSLDFSGNSTCDIGNLVLATKTRLLTEGAGRPGLGLRFGVELPNSSNESGLGNDETDFFTSLLLEKSLGDLRVLGNAGMAILGDPVSPGAQDDLFTYGLALLYPATPDWTLFADFYGRAGAGGIGTEEQSLLRVGGQLEAAGFWWDVAFLAGFRDSDPDTGVIFGLSKNFKMPFFD